jgi:hypothetical protein
MTTTVKQELAKYTTKNDIVTEVETTTTNHYAFNYRFEVLRDNKKYFIAIKEVNVTGEIKKHHTRLEVDTNLEVIKKEVDTEKIESEIEILKDWFLRHTKFKNTRGYISQERKMRNLQNKL